MKTLFSQTFVVFLASLCILLLIVAGLFLFGMRRSIQDWNIYRRHALQNVIVSHLQQVHRQDGALNRDSVHQALSGILTNNQYAYILDENRNALYLYYRGEDLLVEGGEPVEAVLQNLEQSREMLRAVLDGDVPIAFLRANTLGFLSDAANRRFVRSIGVSVAFGLAFSFLLALVTAFLFSRHVSVQAGGVATGLERLSSGARNVHFARRSARELDVIARSAQALQEQLVQEEELRRQWAEDIAHDLRTPIAALKTQFEGLKDGYIRNTPQRVDALFSELLLLEGLVNDLRELNRMESPEMRPEITTIDTECFVAALARTFDALSSRYNARFCTRCNVGSFQADERLLSRGIGNVLQNAFQHVTNGGTVHLDVYRDNGMVVFDVANTGHVDESEIPRLFDRLYRGGNRRNRSGRGLGLAIAKAIVDLHAGDVRMLQRRDQTHVLLMIPIGATDRGGAPARNTAAGKATKGHTAAGGAADAGTSGVRSSGNDSAT